MFSHSRSRQARKHRSPSASLARLRRQTRVEPLENRQLMSVTPFSPSMPDDACASETAAAFGGQLSASSTFSQHTQEDPSHSSTSQPPSHVAHAAHPSRQVYVTVRDRMDGPGGAIEVFDEQGKRIRTIDDPVLDTGIVSDVEVAPNGDIFVALDLTSDGLGGRGTLVGFRSDGTRVPEVPLPNDGGENGQFVSPYGFDIAPDGTFWVAQPNSGNVIQVDRSGRSVRPKEQTGANPLDVTARSSSNYIWSTIGMLSHRDDDTFWATATAENKSHLVNRHTRQITASRSGNVPTDVEELPEGALLVANAGSRSLTKFSASGTSEFNAPTGGVPIGLALGELASDEPGTISGAIFNDIDGDRQRGPGEAGLSGWVVYLDQNENGRLDAGELSTVTDADGSYEFSELEPDRYTVAQQIPAGWEQTLPGGGDAKPPVTSTGEIRMVGNWKGHSHQHADVWGEGDLAFLGHVGNEGGVDIIDVSDPANPHLLSTWTPTEGSGEIKDLKTQGGIGFFATDSFFGGGVNIVDLSNPTAPRTLARITTANNGLANVHNVSVDGDFLYQADSIGPEIRVFDVSNPSNPRFVRTLTSPAGEAVHDVTVRNGRLYTSVISPTGRTDIFDVSNVRGAAPLLGSFTSGSFTHSNWPTEDGKFLAVARETAGGDVRLYDVSDPGNVRLASVLDPASLGIEAFSPHNPVIDGNLLYVAWYDSGLQVFDIADPHNPRHIGSYDTYADTSSTFAGNWGVYPFLGRDRVLLSDVQSGLIVVSTADLTGGDHHDDGHDDHDHEHFGAAADPDAGDIHPATYSAFLPEGVSAEQFARGLARPNRTPSTAQTTNRFDVPEAEPNNSRENAQRLPLGFDAGEQNAVSVTGSLDFSDVDYFAVELAAGDVLGVSATADFGLIGVSIQDSAGTERMGSSQDISSIYPRESPLPRGGHATAAYVAPKPGTYYVATGNGFGNYRLDIHLYRPTLESQPEGSRQILFLDFDGASVDTTVWGGTGSRQLSPLSNFLSSWGLSSSDENAVIDSIIASVRESLADDLRERGDNPRFDIEIRNSRDHADSFGEANVSRIVVGGTMNELGIQSIGIAESIDVGNFDTSETAVVLLDALSAPAGNSSTLNQYGLAPGSTKIDLVGSSVGNIIAHEAGHFFGDFHTHQFNEQPNLMDQGGNIDNTLGVGVDRIFGSADDVDVDFGEDVFVPGEGLTGVEDTLKTIAFGLTTPGEVPPPPPERVYRVDLSAGQHFVANFGNRTVSSELPTLSVADVQRVEGDTGTTDFVFTVTLSKPADESVSVDYATIAGTAAAGEDFQAVHGTLTFPAGTTAQTVKVPVHGDSMPEADETFRLTLSNASASAAIERGEATGTIVNDDAAADAVVRYSLRLTDANGNELSRMANGAVAVAPGQEFNVEVYVDDLRSSPDGGGVFAGYVDLAYDVDALDFVSDSLQYGPGFANGRAGAIDESQNMVDEAGAFWGTSPPGSNPAQLLFTVSAKMKAAAAPGEAVSLSLNAADDRPLHETLLFGENNAVSPAQIEFGSVQLSIAGWHNALMPADVNADGFVSPLDALQVINKINAEGPHELTPETDPAGPPFADVNGDGHLSPIDALQVINRLNADQTASLSAMLASMTDGEVAAQLRLQATDLSGQPIGELTVGESFYLEVHVKDLRESPQGVFAAYLDIDYPTGVSVQGAIEFGDAFANGRSGDASRAGLIDEAGGFATFEPGGGEERLLMRVPMRADSAGTMNFAPNAADVSPAHDVLLFGHDRPLSADQLQFQGASLQVTDRLPGDANGDGSVDLEDLNAVRNNFGARGAGSPGDTNGDGVVDVSDLNQVRNNFGARSDAATIATAAESPARAMTPTGPNAARHGALPLSNYRSSARRTVAAWDAALETLWDGNPTGLFR